jgi:hypothetical protein
MEISFSRQAALDRTRMTSPNDTLKMEKSCPLPSAHTRLRQAHELWHRTVNAYPDPDEFVLNLNQLLVTLRQVTFMIQKQKKNIPTFDNWYEHWRDKMKADPLMVWLHDARTVVEKTGDLDLASTARVAIVASWLDGPYHEFEVSPLLTPQEMARSFPFDELPEDIRKGGLLRVERRWVSNDLPTHELTDVCAHGYGIMASLLAEAHELLGFRMQTFSGESHEGRHHRTDHLGGRLPCMVTTAESRTAHLHLGSGLLISMEEAKVDFDPQRDAEWFDKRMEEMTVGPDALAAHPGEDTLDWGARWMSVARRTLAHDGYHLPHAFLFTSDRQPLDAMELRFDDQAEKYLAFQGVARAVDRQGAEIVIIINEIWEAHMPTAELSPTMLRPSERPDRTEALMVLVATSDGRHRSYHSPFTRDKDGRPVLGKTTSVDQQTQWAPSLAPIQSVWARWRKTKSR